MRGPPEEALVGSGQEQESPAVANESGYVDLFPENTLAGWTGNTDNFTVEGGVVSNREDRGPIFTEKEYADFVSQFDFKLTSGANSGILLFVPPDAASDGDAKVEGVEIQILDDTAEHPYDRRDFCHGSVYGAVRATQGHLCPLGQWNTQDRDRGDYPQEGRIAGIITSGIMNNSRLP